MKKSEVIKKTKDFLKANTLQNESHALMEKAREVQSVSVNLDNLTVVTIIIEEKYKKGFRVKKHIFKAGEIF